MHLFTYNIAADVKQNVYQLHSFLQLWYICTVISKLHVYSFVIIVVGRHTLLWVLSELLNAVFTINVNPFLPILHISYVFVPIKMKLLL